MIASAISASASSTGVSACRWPMRRAVPSSSRRVGRRASSVAFTRWTASGVGRAALDDRVDDLAEGAADAPDPGELVVADADAGVRMDELVLEEPHRGVRRAGQVLVALVLLVGSAVTGMERVQEVESGLQIDAVRVLGGGKICHFVNACFPWG